VRVRRINGAAMVEGSGDEVWCGESYKTLELALQNLLDSMSVTYFEFRAELLVASLLPPRASTATTLSTAPQPHTNP
jgi:hypothetical protein